MIGKKIIFPASADMIVLLIEVNERQWNRYTMANHYDESIVKE
jgi:hypothetical protein